MARVNRFLPSPTREAMLFRGVVCLSVYAQGEPSSETVWKPDFL